MIRVIRSAVVVVWVCLLTFMAGIALVQAAPANGETSDASQQARVLLVSVPYALKAADAETLGGQPEAPVEVRRTGWAGNQRRKCSKSART